MPLHTKTFLEVHDSSGNPTGVIKSYDDIHRDGDWHKSAHVWLINSKGQILLQRRSLNVHTRPGIWDNTAAGHIDTGNTSTFTAHQELKEEMGLDIPEEKFELIGTIVDQFVTNNGAVINNEFDDVYLLMMDVDDADIHIDTDEIAEFQWIHFTDLEKKIKDNDPLYMPRQAEYDIFFPLLHKRFDAVID